MKSIYCCDWGTSSLRIRLVDLDSGTIMGQCKVNLGIASIFKLWQSFVREHPEADRAGFYLLHLLEQLQANLPSMPPDQALVVISGMATSNIGLCELPYADLPFSLDGEDMVTKFIDKNDRFGFDVVLLSGVKDGSEVMRGEETQLIGIYQLLKSAGFIDTALILLPGTHSKHVYTENGSVVKIETHITGELFDLLTNNGLLKEAVKKQDEQTRGGDWSAFTDGVLDSGETGLLQQLFKVRTNQLFSERTKTQNYDYLSGILIGYELRNLVNKQDLVVLLCSEANLYEHYKTALAVLGLGGQTQDFDPARMDQAIVDGQLKIIPWKLCQ